MARPKKQINDVQLKAFMRFKPTLEDTAAWFDCSGDTIERFIRSNYKISYAEFRYKHMVFTRNTLVRKALSMAEKGNVAMLIFCLKNVCGWKDIQDDDNQESKVFTLNYSIDKK